jgi:predicted CopG family antitoxin
MSKLKHITVNQEVYKKLKNLGKAGDSFNDVLIRILETKFQMLESVSRVGPRGPDSNMQYSSTNGEELQ